MVENIFYILGVMIVLVFVGNALGGYAEDQVWVAGGQALPKCDEIESDEWREHCFTIHKTYYDTKFQYQMVGIIIPFIGGIIVVLKTI